MSLSLCFDVCMAGGWVVGGLVLDPVQSPVTQLCECSGVFWHLAFCVRSCVFRVWSRVRGFDRTPRVIHSCVTSSFARHARAKLPVGTRKQMLGGRGSRWSCSARTSSVVSVSLLFCSLMYRSLFAPSTRPPDGFVKYLMLCIIRCRPR